MSTAERSTTELYRDENMKYEVYLNLAFRKIFNIQHSPNFMAKGEIDSVIVEPYQFPSKLEDIVRIIKEIPNNWNDGSGTLLATQEMYDRGEVIPNLCLWFGYLNQQNMKLNGSPFYVEAKPYEHESWPDRGKVLICSPNKIDTHKYPFTHKMISGAKPTTISIIAYSVWKSKACIIEAIREGYKGNFWFINRTKERVSFSFFQERIELRRNKEIIEGGDIEKMRDVLDELGCIGTINLDKIEKQIRSLKVDMEESKIDENYEKCAELRDRIRALELRINELVNQG